MEQDVVPDKAEPSILAAAPAEKHTHIRLHKRSRQHLAIELFLGLFGLFGIGFLLSGKIRASIGSLIFSGVWLAVRLTLLAVTAGFSIVVLLPLTFIFAVSHTMTLRRLLRQSLANEGNHPA